MVTRASAPRNESDEEFLRRINQSLAAPARASEAFHANITIITRRAGPISLDEFARASRARMAKDHRYRIIDENPRQLGGAAAIERTTRVSEPNGRTLQTKEVTCVQNQRLFTITLTAPPATFAHRATEFDAALSTWKWE